MTAPNVTNCPHCSTSFRVTQAQIQAANGAVRCGSCLQVFDARKNLDNKEPTQVQPERNSDHLSDSVSSNENQPDIPVNNESDQPPEPESKPETFPADTPEPSITETEENNSQIEPLSEIKTVFDQLDQEEINFSENQLKKTKWKKTLPTALIALFLSAVLIFQYAWFQRNTLSLNPKFRSSYDTLCQIMSCKLPPLIDIASIKSLQLLVRSHPEQDDALLVDTVIINNASHSQPYPTLHLSFTDINENLLANRAFTVSEYLGGELTGSKEMPAGQPIRLRLEIIDPGQEAVNYALRFSENK